MFALFNPVAYLFGIIAAWLGFSVDSEEGGLTVTGVLLWIFGMGLLVILGWFVLGQSGALKAFVSVVKEVFKTIRIVFAPVVGLLT